MYGDVMESYANGHDLPYLNRPHPHPLHANDLGPSESIQGYDHPPPYHPHN